MASIFQELFAKYGDDAYNMINKLRSGAPELADKQSARLLKMAKAAPGTGSDLGANVGQKLKGIDYGDAVSSVDYPTIKTPTVSSIIPEAIEQSEEQLVKNIPQYIKQPGDTLSETADFLKGSADDLLTPKSNTLRNVGIGGTAVAAGVGGATLLNKGNRSTQDTTNFVGADPDTNNETVADVVKPVDKVDSIENPMPNREDVDAKGILDRFKAQQELSPEATPNFQQERRPADDFDQRLASAQEADRQNNLLFGLLKAAQMGGSALAGSKADTSYADEQLKTPDANVSRFATTAKLKDANTQRLQEAELNDPNSDISKQGMAMLASVYPDIAAKYPNLSAAQLKSMGMNLGQLAVTKERAESRKVTDASNKDERDIRRLEAQKKTGDTNVLKWSTEASKAPAYKRFQENQEAYIFADKLAKGEIDPNGVDDGALILQAVKLAQADSSVVRESDQRLFNNAGGLAQKAEELQQKLLGGGRLTPQTRKAYVDMMLRARSNITSAAKDQTSHLYSKFQKAGIPEDEIPGTLRAINSFEDKSTTINKAPVSNKMRIRNTKTGKEKTVEASIGLKILQDPDFQEVK